MSAEAPAAPAGRKICVARRRGGSQKHAQNKSTFSFTAISNSPTPTTHCSPTQSASSPHKTPHVPPPQAAHDQQLSFSDALRALSENRTPQVVKPKTEKEKNEEAESKPDTFADAAAAATAFSQMSLQQKPRTLFEAVRADDVDLLKELLKDRAAIADQLNYALTMAVTKKSSEMAEILLKTGADPKYLDHCYPLLMTAADLNDSATVALLLKYGVDPNAGGMHGTALHSAMRFGSVDLARQLIEAGARIDHAGAGGLSLLAIAMQANNMECVELILSKSLEQDVVDAQGRTPLHLAAQLGKMDAVQRLKDKGCNPLLPDKEGYLPWMLAVKNKHKKEGDALFPGKADINSLIGAKKKSPLHFACSTGMVRCVERLLREGADINLQDVDGLSPLMEAIRNGHTDVAIVLIKNPKLKIDLTDKDGNTALFTSLRKYHAAPILPNVLKMHGADVNKLLPHGRTIFMDLAQVPEVVKWLLDNGADPTVRSDLGETALGYAVDWSCFESVRLLLQANIPLASLHEVGPRGNSPIEEAASHNRAIMKLMVHAGASVSFLSKWIHSEESAGLRASYPTRMAWLERRCKNPSTLQELCRNSILSCLGPLNLMQKVSALSLCPKLNELLMVDTFMLWKMKSFGIDETEEEESEDEDDDYYEDDTEHSDDYDEDEDESGSDN